jgi:hypothetical protein
MEFTINVRDELVKQAIREAWDERHPGLLPSENFTEGFWRGMGFVMDFIEGAAEKYSKEEESDE